MAVKFNTKVAHTHAQRLTEEGHYVRLATHLATTVMGKSIPPKLIPHCARQLKTARDQNPEKFDKILHRLFWVQVDADKESQLQNFSYRFGSLTTFMGLFKNDKIFAGSATEDYLSFEADLSVECFGWRV